MFALNNSIQAAIQSIIFLLLAYTAYTYLVSKLEHAKLFGLGLIFLALSFASWACATLLWTNPFIEYKTLSYTLQIAAILVFVGCSVNLAPTKYRSWLNWLVIGLAVLSGLYMLLNPMLNGSFIYSLRYYLSFQNANTINVFAVIMAISLILAVFAVTPKKSRRIMDLKHACFIILACCLAISFTSYNDSVRSANMIIMLIDVVFLTVSHLDISIARK